MDNSEDPDTELDEPEDPPGLDLPALAEVSAKTAIHNVDLNAMSLAERISSEQMSKRKTKEAQEAAKEEQVKQQIRLAHQAAATGNRAAGIELRDKARAGVQEKQYKQSRIPPGAVSHSAALQAVSQQLQGRVLSLGDSDTTDSEDSTQIAQIKAQLDALAGPADPT